MISLSVISSLGHPNFEEESCGGDSFSSALPSLNSFILTMLGSFPLLGFGYIPGHNYGTGVGSVIISLVHFEK